MCICVTLRCERHKFGLFIKGLHMQNIFKLIVVNIHLQSFSYCHRWIHVCVTQCIRNKTCDKNFTADGRSERVSAHLHISHHLR